MIPDGANVLWKPHPRQATALSCPAFELLYGGAAGGGKSDFMIIDFLSGVNDWGKDWRGILFRKTYPELEELIRRGREIYGGLGAVYHEQKKTFTFPNGAALQLRSLDRDADAEHYQGHQFTWVGFDELGNYLTEYCWMYLRSRCRSAAGAPCYMRATANPGGVGNNWLKNRFIDGYEPDKVYTDADGLTRCFIPAKLNDNPTLTKSDPLYQARLRSLPEHLRRALLDGDWDVVAGQYFNEWKRDKHVVKPFALTQGSFYKFYAFDWGYNKPYALVKLAVSGDGKVFQYGERYGCVEGEVNKGTKEPASVVAKKAKKDADIEGVTEIVMDPACWGKQDNYPSPAETFKEAGFRTVQAVNDRVPGWLKLHELMHTEDEYGRPYFQVFDNCLHTIRTLPVLLPNKNRPEDVDSDMEDHLADAIRYGVMSRDARNPQTALERQGGGIKAVPVWNVMDDW